MFFQNNYLTKTQQEQVAIINFLINGYSDEHIAMILDVPIGIVEGLRKSLKRHDGQ